MASSSKPKKGAHAAIRAALAPFGFPKPAGVGLCFRPSDDDLFARGFPHMRFLTDEAVPAADAIERATDALDSIDPVLPLAMPRAVARCFLLGYRNGPCLFADQHGNKAKRAARARVIGSDRDITIELLEETLDEHAWGMGDTYSAWRWPKTLYLYEAFLGTEPVARALVRHLIASANDFPRWGFAGEDPTRGNAVHHYLAAALPWLFLRTPPEVVAELRTQLATCRDPETAGPKEPRRYLELLRWLSTPDPQTRSSSTELHALDARTLVPALAEGGHTFLWNVARVAWLLGTDRLADKLPISGHDLVRMVDTVAPIRDAGVVRLIAHIVTQRVGRKAGGDWLRAHADYVRPILRALAEVADPKEQKAAAAAFAIVDAAKPVAAPKQLDDDALEIEIARIFKALGKKLRAAKKKRASLAKAIREAHEAYTEARAAAGDPIPDAYFTHRFGDFGLEDWGMLAAELLTS